MKLGKTVHKILSLLFFSIYLVGCNQHLMLKEKPVSSNLKLDGIYAELVLKNGEYRISPSLTTDESSPLFFNPKRKKTWTFNIDSLEPQFVTSRFECTRSPNTNGCEEYENRENEFITVSFTKSDYGDIPAVRKEKLADEITIGEIIRHTVASPIYAAAGVGALLGLGAGAVIASPFIAVNAIIDPEGTFTRKNWVEFEHLKFKKTIKEAIKKEGQTIEEFQFQSFTLYNELISIDRYNHLALQRVRGNYKKKKEALAQYVIPNVNYQPFKIKEYRTDNQIYRNLKKNYGNNEKNKIDQHYKEIMIEMMNHLNYQRKMLIVAYKKQEKKDFSSAKTSAQWKRFIKNYERNDVLQLVKAARIKFKVAEKKEVSEYKKQQKKEMLARRKHEQQIELQRFPSRPAQQSGVISCRTKCINSQCYRTYGNGKKVKFNAKQKWNPSNNQMEWDSGSC